jgi:hypothetical protein
MNKDIRVFRNIIQTPDGTLLESLHIKDVQEYTDTVDGKTYKMWGGRASLQREVTGGKELTLRDKVGRFFGKKFGYNLFFGKKFGYTELSIECDYAAPFPFVRQNMRWGLLGKDSKRSEHFILLKDMRAEFIEDILRNEVIDPVAKMWMERELKHREKA